MDFLRNFYKTTRNANLSWSVFLTGLDPLSCQLLSGVDWPLASPFTNPSSLSLCLTLWLAFPSYFRSRRDRGSKPFVWFRAKTDKGIVYFLDHLHRDTIESIAISFWTLLMVLYCLLFHQFGFINKIIKHDLRNSINETKHTF